MPAGGDKKSGTRSVQKSKEARTKLPETATREKSREARIKLHHETATREKLHETATREKRREARTKLPETATREKSREARTKLLKPVPEDSQSIFISKLECTCEKIFLCVLVP